MPDRAFYPLTGFHGVKIGFNSLDFCVDSLKFRIDFLEFLLRRFQFQLFLEGLDFGLRFLQEVLQVVEKSGHRSRGISLRLALNELDESGAWGIMDYMLVLKIPNVIAD